MISLSIKKVSFVLVLRMVSAFSCFCQSESSDLDSLFTLLSSQSEYTTQIDSILTDYERKSKESRNDRHQLRSSYLRVILNKSVSQTQRKQKALLIRKDLILQSDLFEKLEYVDALISLDQIICNALQNENKKDSAAAIRYEMSQLINTLKFDASDSIIHDYHYKNYLSLSRIYLFEIDSLSRMYADSALRHAKLSHKEKNIYQAWSMMYYTRYYENDGPILNDIADSCIYYSSLLQNPQYEGEANMHKCNALVTIGDLEGAMFYCKSAEDIYKQTVDSSYLSSVLHNMGNVFKKANDSKRALVFYEEALQYCSQENPQGLYVTMEAIANEYHLLGQYQKASEVYQRYTKDFYQYYQNELESEFAEANIKYETEKKEAELARQQLTIQQQEGTQRLLIGGGLSGLALLGAIFFGYSQRMKRKEKEKEIALQRERDRANDMAELTKAKTDFFNNINHELRTPLSLVLAPLQDIRKKVKNVDILNDVDMAIKNSKRLLSLTDEIMDLAKLDDGKLQILNSDVALSPFMNRVFTAFSSLAESRNIELQMIGELPSGISIRSDISKLEKVLNNLISNAIKYSESSDTVSLDVDSKLLDQNLLKFTVSDTGLGIPQDEMAMIFDRYYQSSITPQSSGTGIGLAFVKELCELMGGKIHVDSVVGQGSRFIVELPVEVIESVEVPHSENLESPILSEKALPISIDGDKAKVLIVEDNEEMSQYLKGLLAGSYNCTTAVNGKEAIELLRQERFDLISSDIMMPEMDGFAFREQVNQHVVWREIPFIMLTARTLEADKLDAFQLGIDDYITKPFSSEEYKARVNSLLKNRQSRLELKDDEISPEQDLINRAKALVVKHIDDSSYKVVDLADELSYSGRQLGRIIKKTTGLKPVEFILEIRLLRAYDLIKSRQFSTVNEVRYQIGIDSHSYFTTKFKERFGISPGDLE